MSKAVLIVEMPEKCSMCHFVNGDHMCHATYKTFSAEDRPNEKRADWCPLKELPERQKYFPDDKYEEKWQDGFNECLYEIAGEW